MANENEHHKSVTYYDLNIKGQDCQTKDMIVSILKVSKLPPSTFYYLGAAIKYLVRVGRKNADKQEMIKDLKKTRDYIQFIIDELENN